MSVDRLRRLISTAPAFGADGEWLADALRRYIAEAQSGLTMDQALGVKPKRGERPWWKRERREQLRRAAYKVADLFPSDESRAEAMRQTLSRYEAGRFRIDQQRQHNAITDPKREALHELLTAYGGTTPARRTLERLLASCDSK